MKIADEIWRDIVGYEKVYAISTLGRVRSFSRTVPHYSGVMRTLRDRILKPGINSAGYETINLYNGSTKKNVKVHRLVAETFLTQPDSDFEVNHKNAIKIDNRLINLEWVSHKENMHHAFSLGIGNVRQTVKCSNGKIYKSINEASIDTGVNSGHLYQVLTGKLIHAKGYNFKRID